MNREKRQKEFEHFLKEMIKECNLDSTDKEDPNYWKNRKLVLMEVKQLYRETMGEIL